MDNTNVQKATVYAAAAGGGNLVHRTRSGIPYLLVQLDDATKGRIAEVYCTDPQLLENANRNFTARVILDGDRRIDLDTGLEDWVDGPMAESLAGRRGPHTVTLSFIGGKLRPWMVTDGTYAGEIRYDISLTAVDLIDARAFNIFDFKPGTFRLPTAPMRRANRVAEAAAASTSVAERVAAAAADLAASPI